MTQCQSRRPVSGSGPHCSEPATQRPAVPSSNPLPSPSRPPAGSTSPMPSGPAASWPRSPAGLTESGCTAARELAPRGPAPDSFSDAPSPCWRRRQESQGGTRRASILRESTSGSRVKRCHRCSASRSSAGRQRAAYSKAKRARCVTRASCAISRWQRCSHGWPGAACRSEDHHLGSNVAPRARLPGAAQDAFLFIDEMKPVRGMAF